MNNDIDIDLIITILITNGFIFLVVGLDKLIDKWKKKTNQELDKALDNYNKTFKVDFKPLVEELFKVIIQYNNRNKK